MQSVRQTYKELVRVVSCITVTGLTAGVMTRVEGTRLDEPRM